MNDKAQGMINANIPILDKVVVPGKRFPAIPRDENETVDPAVEPGRIGPDADAVSTAPADEAPADVLLTEEEKPGPQAPNFFGISDKSASETTQEIAIDIDARQAVDAAVDQVLEKLMPKIETLTRDALRAAVHDILVEQKNKP